MYIGPYPQKCTRNNDYTSRVQVSNMIGENGIEINFLPDKYCANRLRRYNIKEFRLYREGENGADAKKMKYFTLGTGTILKNSKRRRILRIL
jgi:hypothetical protein